MLHKRRELSMSMYRKYILFLLIFRESDIWLTLVCRIRDKLNKSTYLDQKNNSNNNLKIFQEPFSFQKCEKFLMTRRNNIIKTLFSLYLHM